jgi:hypothetical protein
VLPAFLTSDYRRVGYANTWVRPPIEVYSHSPGTNNDGIDIRYRQHLGRATNTVQLAYGINDSKNPQGGVGEARDNWAFSNTTEIGSFTARVTYQKTRLTMERFNDFFEKFRLFGPQGAAIADKYGTINKPLTFWAAGLSYDNEDWIAMAEYGRVNLHNVLGDNLGWYATVGRRVGKFTPYATYASEWRSSPTSDPGLSLAGLPPGFAGFAAGLNAGLNAILSSGVQKTVSIGGRWDFRKDVALKVQYDLTRNGTGSYGALTNVQPGLQPGSSYKVFSAAVDFVF